METQKADAAPMRGAPGRAADVKMRTELGRWSKEFLATERGPVPGSELTSA